MCPSVFQDRINGGNGMGTKWTNEQLQAIESKDSNILVAAAAR